MAALVAAVVALDLAQPVQAQGDEQSGRIVARRLDDGRTEFGWQPAGGERVLPRARYFPADAGVGRWLNSSPVEVDGVEIGRINARLGEDGRIEFAFTPTDGERILPPSRYFPAGARAGRWLRSTEIAVGAAHDPFVAVDAGTWHTCGLRASGEITCWGQNNYGQTDAPAGPFIAVSAGRGHTCALTASEDISCWGSGGWDGQGISYIDPTVVRSGPFTAVSAGLDNTCGLRETGVIECWGRTNTLKHSSVYSGPFSAVSAGAGYACAIRESGEIECWADGLAYDHPPEAPTGRFSAVSADGSDISGHTCGLRTSGEIECWGWDWFEIAAPPTGRFSAVSPGYNHACGLRTGGEIECWRANGARQANPPAGRFTAVDAGHAHTCGLREDGTIECWGWNDDGQTDAPDP